MAALGGMDSEMKLERVAKLTYDQMISMVENVMRPDGKGITSEQINRQLFLVCANCPDPAGALDIIIETKGPIDAKGLVDMALALPPRDPVFLPQSELATTHPLRYMRPA
jgi:hypothetical protein